MGDDEWQSFERQIRGRPHVEHLDTWKVEGTLCVQRTGTSAAQEPDPGPTRVCKAKGPNLKSSLDHVLDPSPENAFRAALLKQRHAWIVEEYHDGRREVRRWNAANMSESAGIIGNIRARPQYRKGTWEQLALKSLVVSIRDLSAP